MDAWLTEARDGLAQAAGVPPQELELDGGAGLDELADAVRASST